jgi:hypothetical protein
MPATAERDPRCGRRSGASERGRAPEGRRVEERTAGPAGREREGERSAWSRVSIQMSKTRRTGRPARLSRLRRARRRHDDPSVAFANRALVDPFPATPRRPPQARAPNRHTSLRPLQQYARPGPDAVTQLTADHDRARRRRCRAPFTTHVGRRGGGTLRPWHRDAGATPTLPWARLSPPTRRMRRT